MTDLLLGIKIGATGGPQTVREVKRIDDQVKKLQDQNRRAAESAKALSASYDLSDAEVQQLIGDLIALEKQSESTANEANRLEQVFTGFFEGLGRQAGQVVVQALQQLGQAVQDVAARALEANAQFDAAGAKVRTLGVDSDGLASRLAEVTKELNGQVSQVDLLAGSYDIISAGFDDIDDIAQIAEASVRGATGGFSDFATVSDAVTSSLNAFGESADQAESFVNRFIATQNAGKITVDQYAQQIGKVAPLAAQAGLSIDELNGFIATATAQGVLVESSFTGLRQAIASVLKPSSQAVRLADQLGVSFDAAALRTKGLQGILAELNAIGADTPDILVELFGSVEAVAAIAPSAGDNLQVLAANIDASANSANAAAEAFETVSDTIPGLQTALQNQLQDSFLELGEAIAPVQAGILGFASDVLEAAANASNGLDGLTAASERLRVVLTQNPELAEKLGQALAKVADEGISQIAQLLDAITAFVSESQNIDPIIGTLEELAGVIRVAGQTARFVIALSESLIGLKNTVESIPVIGNVLDFNASNPISQVQQLVDVFGNLANIVRNVATFIAELVNRFDFLAQNPVIRALTSQILDVDQSVSQLGDTVGSGLSDAIGALGDAAGQVSAPIQQVAADVEQAAEGVSQSTADIEDSLSSLGEANRASLQELAIDAARARIAILESGGAMEEVTEAERQALKQRIDEQKRFLAELQQLRESAAGDDVDKINRQILQAEQSLVNDQLALTQSLANDRTRIRKQEAAEAKRIAEQEAKDRADALKAAQDEIARQESEAFSQQERARAERFRRETEQRREARDQQRREADRALQRELQAEDRAYQQQRQAEDKAFQQSQQQAAAAFAKAQQNQARRFQKQLDEERAQGGREFDVLTSEVERRVQIQQAQSQQEKRDLQERFRLEDEQLEQRRQIEKEVLAERSKILSERSEETELGPLEQARKNFEEELQAKAEAFQKRQQDAAAAFQEIQQAEADARAQQRAEEDQQRADELEDLKDERDEQRREEDRAFEEQERELAEAFQEDQRQQQEQFNEQQRQADIATAKQVAAILESARASSGVAGARKDGGPVLSGQTYLVGEQGPELITPNRRGWVHTARQTATIMGRMPGANVTVKGGGTGRLEAQMDALLKEVRQGRKVSVAGGNYVLNTLNPVQDAAMIELERTRALVRRRGF